jgi:hypothetical protein
LTLKSDKKDQPAVVDRLGHEVNASVIEEAFGWLEDPELGRIARALQRHGDRKAFFDSYAEAAVARHLLARRCRLRFEVPTPAGRHCDFEVVRGSVAFYLHVKRLDTDRPSQNPRQLLKAMSLLRALERINRPYIIQARWVEDISSANLKLLVNQAREFIRMARVGDELKATSPHGHEIGGVRVIAPNDKKHISVTIGLPSGFVSQAPRFRRLMHRAHQQFMPRAVNVILICSGHPDDAHDFETALLGTHVERWDAYPPRGKRVAHGRGPDGFWDGQRHSESQLAVWTHMEPQHEAMRYQLWIRENSLVDAATLKIVKQLFEK